MNQKIRHHHTNMLSYMAVGTLQLATAAVCKAAHFDGFMNRGHRGTVCSQDIMCTQDHTGGKH